MSAVSGFDAGVLCKVFTAWQTQWGGLDTFLSV